MISKQKGDIAELKVMLYLEENGYDVLMPFGDKARYDVVSEKGGIFERIQVKYVTMKNGVIKVSLCSNTKIDGKLVKHKYTSGEIDSIIAYCPDNGNLYKLKMSEIKTNTSVYLRVSDTKTNQTKKINFANDYLLK